MIAWMERWVGRFSQDQRGTSFEGIALSVAVIAVAFVATADLLAHKTAQTGASTDVVAAVRPVPAIPSTIAANDLDQTPTASVPHLVSRSILDPCTGARK